MKVTNINAREDRAGKHNDRNFNLDNAPHIDQNRVKDNIYYTYNGDYEHKFNEIERDYYKEHFTPYLDEQNKKNEKLRHKNRNRTAEEYAVAKYSRPEDKILQIGNVKEHASREELWDCAMEYMRRFDELFGDHCKILDMALHMDEATPHVHVRRVWVAENEGGLEHVSQKEALNQLGITRPDKTKPESSHNNAKVAFTKMDIQLFRDICIERGLDIDMTPPERRAHLSTLEYKKKQLAQDIDELERTKTGISKELKEIKDAMDDLDEVLDTMTDYFVNNPYFDGRYNNELEILAKKDRVERLRALVEMYKKEIARAMLSHDDFDKSAIRSDLEKQLSEVQDFIDAKGLQSELNEYTKEHFTEHNER